MVRKVSPTLRLDRGWLDKERDYDLPKIIGEDLLRFGKLPLCLFIFTVLTAMAVVTTVHHTRLLRAQSEQLIMEHDALDIEWRNLILEETALSNPSRVEKIAREELHLQHINPSWENVVVKSRDICVR